MGREDADGGWKECMGWDEEGRESRTRGAGSEIWIHKKKRGRDK